MSLCAYAVPEMLHYGWCDLFRGTGRNKVLSCYGAMSSDRRAVPFCCPRARLGARLGGGPSRSREGPLVWAESDARYKTQDIRPKTQVIWGLESGVWSSSTTDAHTPPSCFRLSATSFPRFCLCRKHGGQRHARKQGANKILPRPDCTAISLRPRMATRHTNSGQA
jgi:hypothetical protein